MLGTKNANEVERERTKRRGEQERRNEKNGVKEKERVGGERKPRGLGERARERATKEKRESEQCMTVATTPPTTAAQSVLVLW